MLYLGTPSSPEIRERMSAGELGCMTTPAQGNVVPPGAFYACDNGKFGKGWPGERAWFRWLQSAVLDYGADRCLFATAPDVVGDSDATLEQARPWLPWIRWTGAPAAFVAQDGSERPGLIPWGEFDLLFLGGTDEFKLGPGAVAVCAEARARGVPVHMGRVNSRKRLRIAQSLGCATADGTYLAFAPDKNLERLMRWLAEVNEGNPA